MPGSVIGNLGTAPGSPCRLGEKVVALPFDDGPSPLYTPQILRILVAARAPASFEIIGLPGAACPGIVRAENADGMSLVNHTRTHIDLSPLPAWRWPAEVDRASTLPRGVTGHPGPVPAAAVWPERPGGGRPATRARPGRARLGRRPVGLRPGAVVIARRVLAALRPRAIVTMHDGGGNRSQTVAALPAIIAGIRAAGYRIAPVCAG